MFEDAGIGTQIADQRLISTDNLESISPLDKSEDRSEAGTQGSRIIKRVHKSHSDR